MLHAFSVSVTEKSNQLLSCILAGGNVMGVTIVKERPSPHKLPIAKGTITIPEGAKTGGDDIDAGMFA